MDFNGPNIQYETAYIACKQRVPEKELKNLKSELPDNSPNIFKRSSTSCCMERPSATFCNRKYSVFYDFSAQHF